MCQNIATLFRLAIAESHRRQQANHAFLSAVDQEAFLQTTLDNSRPIRIDLKANQTVTVFANLFLVDPPATWKEPLGWTSFSLGLVLLAGGVTGHFFAKDEFQGSKTFEEYELYQNLGYGIGGGLIGLGLLFIIWEAADAAHIKPEDAVADGPVEPTIRPLVHATQGGGVVGAGVQF